MAAQRPLTHRHGRRCLEVARRHPRPLRVEQHLQALRASIHVDRDNLHAWVRLVRHTSRQLWIRREAHSIHRRNLHVARRVQNLHNQRLRPDRQRSRCATGVDVDGRVRVHAPHHRASRRDVVLDENLLPPVEHADTTLERSAVIKKRLAHTHCEHVQQHNLHIVVSRRYIRGPEGSGVAGRSKDGARTLRRVRTVVVDGGCRSNKLILLVDQDRVLALRRLPVVIPAKGSLGVVGEVVGRAIITGSQVSGPTSAEGVQHEITEVQIVVRLVALELARLHTDVQRVLVGPATTHGGPLGKGIVEEVVKGHVVPERARDGGVVPEHTPGLGSIVLVALVEDVFGVVEVVTVEEHAVGGGGEPVRAMVTPHERSSGTRAVHVEETVEAEVLVGVEKAIIRTSRALERGGHLSVTGSSEVPVGVGL